MKKFLILCLTALFAFTGCFSDDEEKYLKIKFKMDGVQKELKSYDGIGFLENTFRDEWSCGWHNGSTERFTIALPGSVSSGSSYSTGQINIFYTDPHDNDYWLEDFPGNELNWDDFTINVERWDGLGGKASGTFQGTMDEGSILITEGYFEASIDEY